MLRQLLMTSALAAGLSAAAWAQDASQTDEPIVPPAETEAGAAPDAGEAAEMQGDTGSADAAGSDMPAAEEAAMDTATQPAEEETEVDAAARSTPDIIAEQGPEQMLAAQDLLGLSVQSPEGEEIGEVQDLLLDQNEKIAGIVVGVGGFLGIGEKHVGISWDKAEVRSDPESQTKFVAVSMTREQLEAAPDFKTQAEKQAEAEAAAAQQQMDTGAVPAPAPATQ